MLLRCSLPLISITDVNGPPSFNTGMVPELQLALPYRPVHAPPEKNKRYDDLLGLKPLVPEQTHSGVYI